ncbi:MAG: dihydrolipoyl dehydrogenase [Candidatus Omnitrophica bacterium]|nr:dihydrolipoyl dehydrogenase [Candidatus Omnitrophota bacterium]
MYDLTIIGGGWAGFNAGLKARELGLKTCLIEKKALGGTCLNAGCIPTKTLIQSAKIYSLTKKSDTFGIETRDLRINFKKIQDRKNKIIQQLHSGMQFMLKGIDFKTQGAQIISPEEIRIGEESIKTKFILIATGSKPIELKGLEFDSQRILSSDDILNLEDIPTSLLIIGGGVIGCEFANLFSNLGSEVTIAEKMPQLLPGEDKDIAKKIEAVFKKKGIKINTNTDAHSLDLKDYKLILVCVGRIAKIDALGLEKIGVSLDKTRVITDEYLKTNIPNIYAAGDCTSKVMLAHFAAYQGSVAAENIAHPQNPLKADNTNIPNCIFTEPQIASIGLKEEEAASKGIDINIKKFDFLGSGMARILDETDGFIKIISDNKTDGILGASIIGPGATELIGILTLAVSTHLKVSEIRKTIFAHPTLSETIGEAIK